VGDGCCDQATGIVASASRRTERRADVRNAQTNLESLYGRNIRGVKRSNGVYHLSYHSRFFVEFFEKLGVKAVDSSDKEVPVSLFTGTREAAIGFLQGSLHRGRNVRDSPKSNSSWIALTSKSRRLLQGVQLLLLNLGVKSQILERSRPARTTIFRYTAKDGSTRSYGSDGILFELAIFGESPASFFRTIGFLDTSKPSLLPYGSEGSALALGRPSRFQGERG